MIGALVLILVFAVALARAIQIAPNANIEPTNRRPRRMGKPPHGKPPKSKRSKGKRPTVTWRKKGAGQFESK